MSQKSKKTNVTHQEVCPFTLLRKIAASAETPLSGAFRRVTNLAEYESTCAKFDPSNYSNSFDFGHDYLCHEVIRKFDNLGTSTASDRAGSAITAFHTAELACAEATRQLTNTRILPIERKALCEPGIHRARQLILSVLGSLPNLNELFRCSGFSGGASLTMKRTEGSDPASKYSMLYPEVTPRCLNLARFMIGQSPIWTERFKAFRLTPGNRITTVPKNYKTDRTIAIEPSMNMYIQKGVGTMFRRRLKRVGINLDDQSVNQKLARQGSLDNSLATIDLAAASDTISNELVAILLPPGWFDLLQMIRCEEGVLPDGSIHRYSKISSMGNGFTFELESLIFWALTKSMCSSDDVISVYGDDIIAPSDKAHDIIEVLNYCGFTTNSDKTFITGAFRESCGKHYFNGTDVSPFYHKQVGTRWEKNLLLANNIRRYSMRVFNYDFLRSAYDYVIQTLPVLWRKPRIPDGFGDGALIGTLSEVQPTFKGGMYKAKVLASVPRQFSEKEGYDLGRYLSVLKILEGAPPDPVFYKPSDPTVRLKTTSIRVWQWCDLY